MPSTNKPPHEALYEPLHWRIQRLRGEAGFTQREFADRVGVDYAHLCRLEQGRIRYPKLADIRAIAEELNMSIDDLVYGKEKDV